MIGAVLLAGCGGDASSIYCEGSSTCGTGSNVASILVTSSTQQISTDGTVTATITAVAKDASNNLVSGATVTFAASSGGIAVTSGTTNASGQATATLSGSGLTSGTSITVTATSGSASGKVSVTVNNVQQSINLTTSLPQIPSDGSKSATITALARDANNNAVPGVTVTFTATSGTLIVTQATTDDTGSATATLSAAPDPTNRSITVTATAGSATSTVPVSVTGTTLSIAGPTNLVLGGVGTYTVSLLNSSNVGISGQTVTLSSASGNTLSSSTFVTGSNGQQTVTLTAAHSANDTLTAKALGLTASQAVAVSGQSFSFTTPAANNTGIDLGNAQTLTVSWLNNGTPQVGQTVNFAATRGTLSAASAVTNAQGQASVTISSVDAGAATVTASAANVTATTNVDFIATNPASIALDASPATILTLGQSTISAVVRDAHDNLVQGATVNFQTIQDSTGGTLSTAQGVTNSQGLAQTVYTATATQSATNGVVIQATIQGNTSVSQTTDLTVGGQSVGLTLGTGDKITEINGANGTPVSFVQAYTVLASDTAGHPVAGAPVTLTVHALHYFKGQYIVSGSSWVQAGTYTSTTTNGATTYSVASEPVECVNEDNSEPAVNNTPNPDDFNGLLDPGEDGCNANGVPYSTGALGTNEACNADGNGNGVLDPGITAVASPGSVTTDSNGTANFEVVYPESDAGWVEVELIASTNVSGSESTKSVTFILKILADYLTTTTVPPPGQPSPFGVNQQCNVPN